MLLSPHSRTETVGLTEADVEHGRNKSDDQLREDKQLLSGPQTAEIRPVIYKWVENKKLPHNRDSNQCQKQFILISVKINQYLIIWLCSGSSDGSFVFRRASTDLPLIIYMNKIFDLPVFDELNRQFSSIR